ncbi:ATP-binding protein [Acidovorax sp.]|uniref:ATP-binding protein n=1 Tax=Acidovorax sp. TaxID=1872122 RepID=UPI002ACDCFC2|nr:ATP-binding protein [Acidovorax sp.]MDZ7864288.1 ATP-binding protein [Acidovorax sp.]
MGTASGPPRTPEDAAPTLRLRVLLRFEPAQFEQAFGEHYLSFYHRYAQGALVLGLLLVLGDFLVDWIAYPAVAVNALRLQVAVPILLVGLAYTFLPQVRRHWQPVLAGFIVALSLCLFWILLRIDAAGGEGLNSWVGILNFTFLEFYCFIVLGLQFRWALMAGLSILVAFCATLWWHPGQSAGEAAYWSYHVLTLFLLAVGVGWWREFIVRKDYAAQWALERARLAAEQMALVKSEFLATMSHEIRTPLNGVLGMNELLLGSGLSREQRGWAGAVQASGRHLLALIDDVLDVSKIEAGQLRLEQADFDLRREIGEAQAMFVQPALAKGLDLQAQVKWQMPECQLVGDPLRLRQIVANLIGNAIKFTEQGRVGVQVWVAPAPVAGRAQVDIVVQDSGIGIPAEAQQRIFERFAQADGSTTRRFGGTGLGLAICRDLAQAMGGDIAVHSQPGAGSRFTVQLELPMAGPVPARTDHREEGAAGAAVDDVPRLQGTVLLVEDHPVNRAVAAGMLRKLGLAWREAHDGAQAIEQVRAHDFDAVLMDCQMPVVDGYAATRAIRGLPDGRGASLPIIALTANAGADDAARCRASGMDGFIAKPYGIDTLAAALAPWLQAQRAPPVDGPQDPGVLAGDHAAAIDARAVETLLYLDEQGGTGLLREVVTGFLGTAAKGLADMEQALADGRHADIARMAHGLKSSAAHAGALEMAEGLRSVERRALAGDAPAVRQGLAHLHDAHRRTVAGLQAVLEAHP